MKLHPVYKTPMIEFKSISEINALRRQRRFESGHASWDERFATAMSHRRKGQYTSTLIICLSILLIYLLLISTRHI
jgi:hypothetical protein